MLNIKNTLLVVVLGQLSVFVAGQCKFTAQDAEDESRVVVIQNGGHLEILNEDKVPADTTLYFICSDDDVVPVKCQRNERFNRSLPIKNCVKPHKASVQLIRDDSCKSQTYMVAYEFRGEYLEIYRSCFDEDHKRAVVATHIGNPYSIVTKRPSTSFTRDGIITVKDATSYQAKSIFQRFKDLLGPNQNYIKSQHDIIINRGHLVPSADFVFDSNMNATFKYINLIPQFSSINRGNWKAIENYIRKRIDETGRGRIWTGGFDVLELKDQNNNWVPIYLLENHKNPIPKWIFKMLNNEQESVVFLTYNNIFDANRPVPACVTTSCPISLKNSPESGFTFCCNFNKFKKNVLPFIH